VWWLSAGGYLSIAPALYERGNRVRCVVRTLRSLSKGSGDAVDDLIAARDRLAADRRCTGKVGSVGFCIGGGLRHMAEGHRHAEPVVPGRGELRREGSLAAQRSTPQVLRGIERITGIAYSEPEAEDAWRRILAFFDTHLR
jgi:carboxymethylenebutenolidase